MTQTVVSQQLQLVNIISISETKLCNNFHILQRRLNSHDRLFDEYFGKMNQDNQNLIDKINSVETESKASIEQINVEIKDILSELKCLNEYRQKHDARIKQNEDSVAKINDELFNTQLQFEEKLSEQQNCFSEVTQDLSQLRAQVERVTNQLSTKQSKVEVERIIKEIEQLKEKDVHFEAEIKLNQHKIEKMEILNQKNERLQAKKDVEVIKEIQERAKREVKAALKSLNLGPNAANLNPSSAQSSDKPANNRLSNISMNEKENYSPSCTDSPDSNQPSLRKKLPFHMEEEEMLLNELMKSNLENPLSKLTDRINKMQVQIKDVNEVIKSSKFKKEEKSSSSDGIKDKINELKPQVIKLWAKFDTLEDRLSFNEKKMDEKNKVLNDLVSSQKENNWQKMEEKVKTLQTQIFTNLKDLKSKLENKVNTSDYEKFVLANDDRIKQINELIYLKSDKLEVKKALLFLESKIKEIILVISEDEENEKDALLTKKPLKCISCDKDVDKFVGMTSGHKGNWDGMPYKDHAPENLGRFGMTSFGSLSKKLKRLEGKDLPLLNKKHNFGNNGPSSP